MADPSGAAGDTSKAQADSAENDQELRKALTAILWGSESVLEIASPGGSGGKSADEAKAAAKNAARLVEQLRSVGRNRTARKKASRPSSAGSGDNGAAPSENNGASRTIFVVDDEELARKVACVLATALIGKTLPGRR
ncbi:hypothetical protein ACFL59_02380 [Planctomycetota bacterium]